MHNHHNHHHLEPPHTQPTPKPNPKTRPEPNKPNTKHESSPPPPQPETLPRVPDPDPDPELTVGGAIVLCEKYYSPLMSPSEATYTSPSSTMHTNMHTMHMHVRDDFPPPKLSSLQSNNNHNNFLSFKENQEYSYSPDHPSPPLPLPPRPPAPPPRVGILYGGGAGRNQRKQGVEPVKMDVGLNNMNINMNNNMNNMSNNMSNNNSNNSDRSIMKGNKMKMNWLKKVNIGLRILELVFCVVSFSVMGSDKTQGWSGDSYDRYKEYRFCFTMNIVGFAYGGVQALKLVFSCIGGKHCIFNHHLCFKFDFLMDQIIAYLSVAAATAAATRVEDWELNWGKDEFTKKASMSITMAFLAFIAFASNSLISGYYIFNP